MTGSLLMQRFVSESKCGVGEGAIQAHAYAVGRLPRPLFSYSVLK